MTLTKLTCGLAAASLMLIQSALGHGMVITDPPATLTAVDGSTATITVAVVTTTPSATLSYQWYKGSGMASVALTGKTSNKLVLSNIKSSDAGEYILRVTESADPANPAFAAGTVVTVNVRPKILTQPKATKVTEGTEASFTVVVDAAATAPVSYTWQKKTGTVWADVPGAADAPQLLIPNAQLLANAGAYRVKITNPSLVTVTSAEAVLKVDSRPAIVTQPAATLNIAYKGTGSLKVVAAGNPTLKYQWFKGTPSPGTNKSIDKATSATLTLKGDETIGDMSGPGTYFVEVRNGLSPLDAPTVSAVSTVNVYRKPTIQTQPQKATVSVGAGVNHTLTVVAHNVNPGTLTYQWYKDGKAVTDAVILAPATDPRVIAGALTANLSFSPISWLDRGSYKVVIKNEVGSVTSSAAVLTVNSGPIILTQPVNALGPTKGSRSFSVVAGGSATLKYEWFFRPSGGAFGTTPIGKAAKLTISGLKADHIGDYKCRVFNNIGSVETNPAFLQVDDPPKITVQLTKPSPPQTLVGTPLNLSVTATGTATLHYNWQRNNVSIPGAADSPNYTNPTPALGDSGTYRVIVTNQVGTATSVGVPVSIQSPPTIVTPPADVTFFEEGPAEMTVVAAGTATLKYQWQKESVAPGGGVTYDSVAGKTAAKLSFPKVDVTNGGTYRCMISNSVGTIFSPTAVLTIDPIPVATLGAFTPGLARANEKVRLFGSDLKYTKDVKVGTLEPSAVKAGFVIESDSSILITIPGDIPITATNFFVYSKHGHAQASGFIRTENFANNFTNQTLVFGSDFTMFGSTKFMETYYGALETPIAYYTWRVPVPSTCYVTATATTPGFDLDLSLNLKTAAGVIISPGVFRDYIGIGTESLSITTTFANQEIQISTSGARGFFVGTTIIGDFQMRALTIPTRATNNVAGAPPTSTAIGTKGWKSTGSEETATVSERDDGTPAIRFGGDSAATEPVFLWTEDGPSTSTGASITTSFTMSLDSAETGDDNFAWQVDAPNGDPLIALWFNTTTGAINAVEPDGTEHASIQRMVAGSTHNFEITVDNVAGTWVATMDGVAVTDPISLPGESRFGEVSAVWDLGQDGVASGAVMVFDDFRVKSFE